MALVTRGAAVNSARAATRQVDLDILWQEWLTVQQARTLFVQSVQQSRKQVLLRQAQMLYEQRFVRSYQALAAGNLTLNVTGIDLTALLDSNTKVNQMESTCKPDPARLQLLAGAATGDNP